MRKQGHLSGSERYESDGKSVRLLSGIFEGDQVMLNIGQSISEGDQVQPEEENDAGAVEQR